MSDGAYTRSILAEYTDDVDVQARILKNTFSLSENISRHAMPQDSRSFIIFDNTTMRATARQQCGVDSIISEWQADIILELG